MARRCPRYCCCEDDQACVLLGRDDGQLRVIEADGTETRVTAQALNARYLGNAILARVAYGFDERAPELGGTAQRHWFWGALLEHRALYRDVLLAAAMVNLFALALPLFTMNVYDRVVPNRATGDAVDAGGRRCASCWAPISRCARCAAIFSIWPASAST